MQRAKSFLNRLYLSSIDHFIHWRKHGKEYFWAILIALVLRSTVVTIYKIPTGSMIPTFMPGDVLIANRFFYGLKIPFTDHADKNMIKGVRDPEVGDVIIFRAPSEKIFYQIEVQVNSPLGSDLLYEINRASSFKRPLSTKEDAINYVFTLGDPESYTSMMLHPRIFHQFKDRLYDPRNPHLFAYQPRVIPGWYMTYHENSYPGFLRTFFDIPLKGLAIVTTVILKTPMCLHLKALWTYSWEALLPEYKKMGFLRRFESFSLYPNRYVDMTKDFVKRVVAAGGDTVEIKDKVLYVNGQARELVERHEGRERGEYVVYQTTFDTRTVDGTKTVSHPVRYKKNVIGSMEIPSMRFEAALWPYDPNVVSDFRDTFGPIKVPEGHYFVLGDNRDHSLDSRFWGCVPRWAIKGSPMIKIMPKIERIK